MVEAWAGGKAVESVVAKVWEMAAAWAQESVEVMAPAKAGV
jgi:hypothetical protein